MMDEANVILRIREKKMGICRMRARRSVAEETSNEGVALGRKGRAGLSVNMNEEVPTRTVSVLSLNFNITALSRIRKATNSSPGK